MAAVDMVVAAAVDHATESMIGFTEVGERLTDQARSLDPASYDPEHLDALRAAVYFRLGPDGAFRGDFAGGGTTPWPRALAEVGADALDVWRTYAAHVRSAALRAHLCDLLAAANARPAHEYARKATVAYRDAVPGFLAASDQNRGRHRAVQSLTRALDLAAQWKQRDSRALVVQDILALTGELLDADPVSFGPVCSLSEALHSRRLEPDAVRNLIERAVGAYPDVLLQVRLLRMLRAMDPEPAARKDIDRRIVTAMINEADRTTGALRLTWLDDAATVARDAGLADLNEQMTTRMQSMRQADLGLVPTSAVVLQLTPQEVDAALAVVDQANGLADAFWRIADAPPPAGTIDVAQKAARLLIPTAPLVSSIPHRALNPVGPVPVSPASADALANMQAEYQVLTLQRRGLAVAVQLDRIGERFAPSEEDLTAVFVHPVTGSPSQTRMLVRAFQYYFAGQDDAAAHLALPRVEALLREIERGRNVPVLAVAKGATPGGLSQFGALIAAMPQAGFDEDWTRSFALLLTDGERGLNLRNKVGHGLCDCPSRHLVALILHAALFLLAVAHRVIILPAPRHTRSP